MAAEVFCSCVSYDIIVGVGTSSELQQIRLGAPDSKSIGVPLDWSALHYKLLSGCGVRMPFLAIHSSPPVEKTCKQKKKKNTNKTERTSGRTVCH